MFPKQVCMQLSIMIVSVNGAGRQLQSGSSAGYWQCDQKSFGHPQVSQVSLSPSISLLIVSSKS
jgi:hypothetical protein